MINEQLKNSRIIAHMDMDAFFAAVEIRDNPSLRGKPVIIGSDPKEGKGRGVVSTCSYEARKFGIHSAMPISLAYQKCPQGIYLRGSFSKYKTASNQIFQILSDFTPDIQPISIDEAFLDLTGSAHLFGTPLQTCQLIKNRIKKETGLTASIGIAPNKMTAKIASDFCKPDGLLEITEDKKLDFLWSLPIERLWGVGKQTKKHLNQIGIHHIKDINDFGKEQLVLRLGEHGAHLFQLANGIDERPVAIDETIKSVSNEYTFDQDVNDIVALDQIISMLSEKVSRRLRKIDLKGRTISVKIRLKGFKTFTRAKTLSKRINYFEDIYETSKMLFNEFYQKGMYFRLIGVRVSNFDDVYVQDDLFKLDEDDRKEKLHQVLDRIKDKFGDLSIQRGR